MTTAKTTAMTKVKTTARIAAAIAISIACVLLMGAAPAVARDRAYQGIAGRISAQFQVTDRVTFNSHGRLDVHFGRASAGKGVAITSTADRMFADLRGILWNRLNFRILETRVESSRFGSVAHSTIQLDGIPVIDQYMRVSTRTDGSVKTVQMSMPPVESGFAVSPVAARTTLDAALETICDHAADHFDGLICPPQAQRVWFMDENGLLAPGGRALLKSADMSSLREAIVDLRTGKIVRFVELARR